jgi:hypothetical protein
MASDEPVMFQGKWIDVDNGSFFIPDDLAKQIQDSPPKPGTLYGRPIVIEDNREHPGNCHNGSNNAEKIATYWVDHSNQCQATIDAIKTHGLTRNGACPTIRDSRKVKS